MNRIVSCIQCGCQIDLSNLPEGAQAQCGECGAALDTQLSQNPYQPPIADRLQTDAPAQGGPSDRQFRIGAAVAVPLVLLAMAAAVFGMAPMSIGAVVVICLGWFVVFFGIAALVDPNIPRAAGKFGTHLPMRTKCIAGIVGALALVCSLVSSYFVLMR